MKVVAFQSGLLVCVNENANISGNMYVFISVENQMMHLSDSKLDYLYTIQLMRARNTANDNDSHRSPTLGGVLLAESWLAPRAGRMRC